MFGFLNVQPQGPWLAATANKLMSDTALTLALHGRTSKLRAILEAGSMHVEATRYVRLLRIALYSLPRRVHALSTMFVCLFIRGHMRSIV
jgi:hypothetical protein